MWCQCHESVKQKLGRECYCYKEHKLLTNKIDNLEYFKYKNGFGQYVAHSP